MVSMHEIHRAAAGAKQRASLSMVCEGWADLTRYVAASRSLDLIVKASSPTQSNKSRNG
jgi:hypothetical protein